MNIYNSFIIDAYSNTRVDSYSMSSGQKQCLEEIKYLVSNYLKGDVDQIKDKDGNTLLMLAAKRGDEKFAKELVAV